MSVKSKNQVLNPKPPRVSVKSAQLLAVNLYDVTVAPAVEKAIGDSPLGVTPARDGDVILVAIPVRTLNTKP